MVRQETGLYHVPQKVQTNLNSSLSINFFFSIHHKLGNWVQVWTFNKSFQSVVDMCVQFTQQRASLSQMCISFHPSRQKNAFLVYFTKALDMKKGETIQLSLALTLGHTHIRGQFGAWKITGLYHFRPRGGVQLHHLRNAAAFSTLGHIFLSFFSDS